MLHHATEAALSPAERRAHYFVPDEAFKRSITAVPAAIFRAERARAFAPDCPTGFIECYQSEALGYAWPATTPAMLARYVVVRAGDRLDHRLQASGLIYYVLRGAGTVTCAGEKIAWGMGDGFCLPGNADVTLASPEGAILMLFSDEPLLHLLRATGAEGATGTIRPTLFPVHVIDRLIGDIHDQTGEQITAGKSVTYVTDELAGQQTTTPTLIGAINSLEPGGDQRPHKHSSAALTLPVWSEGLHSTLNGEVIPWEPDTLFVTPANAVHSHHNRGPGMMRSFVVQDTALHSGLRSITFAWGD